MVVYTDKNNLSQIPLPSYEYEILNELKDTSNHSDSNCLFHTRFLFEIDNLGLEDQMDLAINNKNILVRVTYSGSKSLHCIVEFDKDHEEFCKQNYKAIWNYINDNYFKGLCDTQTKNPSRLTRRPGVCRKDTGNLQECLYDVPNNYFPDTKSVVRAVRAGSMVNVFKQKMAAPRHVSLRKNNGQCFEYEPVKYFLNKSFPNVTGNGDSASSLFKALRCCLKYNDEQTRDLILNKARLEHWTETELNRMIKNIEDKYL